MNEPLVSIIIPAYNRAELIAETLDSVYEQQYQPIELIVVNDGSSDNTMNVVNSWIKKKENRFGSIIFHSFEKNKGKSEAVNYGFSIAQGEFIMILDSDDVLTDNAISAEIEYLRNHSTVDAVFAGAYLLDNKTKTEKLIHTTQNFSSFNNVVFSYGDILLKGNCIVASTVLMKKELVIVTGGYRSELYYTHDFDYWIRISRKYNLGYVNVPILYYRRNVGDGSSLQLQKTFSEILLLLNENTQRYTFCEILRAILIQTKFHFVTSSSAHSFLISFSMIIRGLQSILKFIFTGKLI